MSEFRGVSKIGQLIDRESEDDSDDDFFLSCGLFNEWRRAKKTKEPKPDEGYDVPPTMCYLKPRKSAAPEPLGGEPPAATAAPVADSLADSEDDFVIPPSKTNAPKTLDRTKIKGNGARREPSVPSTSKTPSSLPKKKTLKKKNRTSPAKQIKTASTGGGPRGGMGGPSRNRQVSRWCFTWNNYPLVVNFVSYFASVFSNLKRAVWGYEVGASGTRHLQGYLEMSRSVRFNTIHQVLPDCHLEASGGTPAQNYKYSTKDGCIDSIGDWSAEKRLIETGACGPVTITEIVKSLVSRVPVPSVYLSKFYLSRKRAYDEVATRMCSFRDRYLDYLSYCDAELRVWQYDVCIKLFDQCDRKVLWVYDTIGNKGKSFLARYLHSCYSFDLIDGVTNSRDVCMLLSNNIRGIVFDITRETSLQDKINYDVLERVKSGFIMSGKYAGMKRLFRPPPTLVFANFPPDEGRLSADRWEILNIDDCDNGLSKKKLQEEAAHVPPPTDEGLETVCPEIISAKKCISTSPSCSGEIPGGNN